MLTFQYVRLWTSVICLCSLLQSQMVLAQDYGIHETSPSQVEITVSTPLTKTAEQKQLLNDILTGVGVTAEGLAAGFASYYGWLVIHESSHALAVEIFGGHVSKIYLLPEKEANGHYVFGYTEYQAREGGFNDTQSAVISLAPNIMGTIGATVGLVLWSAGMLPENRFARIPFTAFQIGAVINLGFIPAIANTYPGSDCEDAIQSMGLTQPQENIFRIAMVFMSIIGTLPAIDGVYNAITGRSVIPSRHPKKSKIKPSIAPMIGTSIGLQGTF